MSKQDFKTKLTELENLPQELVKAPTQPVDVTVQEAEDLFIWVQGDKKVLIGIGLDWDNYVLDLPVRTGACRYAQAIWNKERYGRDEAARVWKEELPRAHGFRNDLLADMRFAFRRRPDLLARVRSIAGGDGNADMIQDLMDIGVLGKANLAEFEAIDYDLSRFDLAEQKSDCLAELLARANGATLDNSKAKDIRDRAFTHLKEAMDEIRETGKYAFRKDPERYKGYISRYRRR